MNKTDLSNGVNVIGYFKGSFGLSETARLVVAALKAQSIPYSLLSADHLISHHNLTENFDEPISQKFVYPVNLFCIDQEGIVNFAQKCRWQDIKRRHNVALWFWETNVIPLNKQECWHYLDEMWVASRYAQEHLAIASSLPVYVIPHAMRIFSSTGKKSDFGLDEKYTFLFCFDFYSSEPRKNPEAAIYAFQQAFPERKDVQFVIKSQNADSHSKRFKSLKQLIANDSRIIWMDKQLDAQARYDLMQACDCYISLHRSEGFGHTMAETMLMGKPVIATGYSGNLEFMHEDNSFLCPYTLIPIGKNCPPYPANGIWADVDIDDAAKWMKFVTENEHETARRAKEGQAFILKHHSLKAMGERILKRLHATPPRRKSKRMPPGYLKKKYLITPLERFFVHPSKQLIKRVLKTFY